MAGIISGEISDGGRVVLSGVLSVVTKSAAPRFIIVGADEYDRNNYVKDAVYVLCEDKTDITTLYEVYCNGVLVATTEAELAFYIGVLPSVIY